MPIENIQRESKLRFEKKKSDLEQPLTLRIATSSISLLLLERRLLFYDLEMKW